MYEYRLRDNQSVLGFASLEIEDGQADGFDGRLRECFYQAAAAKLPAAMSIEPGDRMFCWL